MSGTKIQINSLAALERLIGNDSELELELRASIVQEFAQRHLKGVAQVLIDKGLAGSVENVIKNHFVEVSGSYSWSQSFRMRPEFEAGLVATVKSQIEEIIRREVAEQVKQVYEMVNTALKAYAENALQAVIPNITDQIITERVKQKLLSL